MIGALAIGAVAACASQPRIGGDEQTEALFAAERSFAAMSVREGMRAAFRANFAADGMVFWPAPVKLHDALAEQRSPANPKAFTLDWHPVTGGVARSGELGFTAGPWKRTDNVGTDPARHGIFISVWRHDGNRWQVVADAGVATSAAIEQTVLAPGPRIGPIGSSDPAELGAIERSIDGGARYTATFTDDAMFASDATGVLRGAAAVALWSAEATGVALAPMRAAIAKSGDLGYSYGAMTGSRKGWYLHLWMRDQSGAWRIAVATHQREP